MKTKLIITSLLFWALFIISCENESQPTFIEFPESESSSLEKDGHFKNLESAYQEMGEVFQSAFVDGDVDAFMSCFWNSPKLINVGANGQVTHGWDANYAGVEGLFNVTEPGSREVTIDELSQFVLNNELYTVGLATIKFKFIDGPLVEYQEVWTDVTRKIKGKLVIVMNHAHDLTPF